MIFGKKQADLNNKAQLKLIEKALGVKRWKFLCKLEDGRLAVCQHVWEYADCGISHSATLFQWSANELASVRSYPEQSIDHIRLTYGNHHERMKSDEAYDWLLKYQRELLSVNLLRDIPKVGPYATHE